MQKINVIARISCYLEHSVVTLVLRKEYLNTVTHNTPVLLRIKNWTVWYIERYFMSTYTGVTYCQKQSGFLAHPVYIENILNAWKLLFCDGFCVCSTFFCTLRYTVRQRAYVIYNAIIYSKRPLLRLRPLPSNNELSAVKAHFVATRKCGCGNVFGRVCLCACLFVLELLKALT